tara:strand:+ start:35768 stop:36898 length:1131 start_codon:yes stop_codon:yes gene_type:complete
MKKNVLLILFLVTSFFSNAQWYYLNSDCAYDNVRWVQSSGNERNYLKFKISFGSKDLKEKYYYDQLSFLAEMRVFYSDTNSNSCPWDENSDGSTSFKGEKSTVSVKLMKDTNVVDIIVDDKEYADGENRDLLRDLIKNYNSFPVDAQLGGGYSLLFSLRIEDNSGYYISFDKTVNAKSSEFTIGRGSEVIYPEENSIINTLTPTIKWEALNPTTDYRAVIYKITEPATFSWSSSTGVVNGAIYDSNNITSLEKEIPSNILEHNTTYGVLIINTINGFRFGKPSTFTTGSELSIVDEEFQKQLSVFPNPANSLINVSFNNSLNIHKLLIFDINGRFIKSKKSGSFKKMNISDLTSGVYFLKIENSENKSAVFRIVKN